MEVVGSVVLDESTAGFRSARRRIILANGAIALGVLGVAMVFVHGFSARLSRPVRRLAEAAMAVGQGRFDVRVAVDRDDELGALERGFNAMVWDLSTLEETKRNIVANVSHELRTPLVPIRSYAELLGTAKLGPLTPKQAHACESILRGVDKLETLIQSLLEFAMAYEGRIELARDRFDLREVLAEISRGAADLVEHGVRLKVDLGPAPLPVVGDRVRLERVFTNLASNAMKFAAHEVSLQAHKQNGWIEVAVADDGVGMASEIVPRIFDRFFQADASATRRFGGVGIGLALVKEFVTLHGGEVLVQSAPGRGSTFTVRLPMAAELPEIKAPVVPAAPRPLPSPERKHVLVVDDEPDNLEVLSLLLQDAGYEVTTAASGEDALRQVSGSRPDMIVLDVAMEGIDGFETCRRLRRLDVPRMPVALVTAHVGGHIQQNAIECGADRVLTKPCGAAELLGTIAELSG
jgi:signal transduction histidine kinase/CheY-like chemotaxis protein